MADWQVIEASAFASSAPASGDLGILVTSGGSANTYGSYSTLLDPIPFETKGLIVNIGTGLNYRTHVDLAIGSAGNEVVFVSRLFTANTPNQFGGGCFLLPIRLPAGARLSARVQSNGTSANLRVSTMCIGGGGAVSEFVQCEAIGLVAATTDRITIACSHTANTKSTWTELTAATASEIREVLFHHAFTYTSGTLWYSYDIGLGAAGSEIILLPDVVFLGESGRSGSWFGPIPCRIPEGSRVAMRVATNISSSSNLASLLPYGFS
jgi:hypothetical protein